MSRLPIYIVNGAPAVGKSTVSLALAKRFERAVRISVDDLREWVVSGIAHPTNWNEETVRQFRLAEEGAVDLALRYQEAGFMVAIDHCRRTEGWDEVLVPRLHGRPHAKIILWTDLEENLHRNRSRTTKWFDYGELVPIIRELNPIFGHQAEATPGWFAIENPPGELDLVVERILGLPQHDYPAEAGL